MEAVDVFVLLVKSCPHVGGLSYLLPSPVHRLSSVSLITVLVLAQWSVFSMVYLSYHAHSPR